MNGRFGKSSMSRVPKGTLVVSAGLRANLLLGLLLLVAIFFLVTKAEAKEPATTTQIIVKFKAESDKQPGVFLRQDAPFQPIKGEGLLEAFSQNHSVLSAVPFFRKTFVQDLREAQTVFLKEMEDIKSRFPKRSARIPEDAVIPDVANVYLLEMPIVIQATAAVDALS